MRRTAFVFALVVIAAARLAQASPIGFCGAGATPCTGVEILNVSGLHASYDTGPQMVGPFEGEAATVGLTSVGIAGANYVGGDQNDAAASIFAWFTMPRAVITGGSGTGTMEFSWSLEGSLSNGPVTGTCSTPNEVGCSVSVELNYGSLFGLEATSATLACCTATTLNIDRTGTLAIQFTYGQAFTPAWYLQGFMGEGMATLSFLNTADVTGLVIPSGATLNTLSGAPFGITVSNAVSPVPEPSSLLLMLTGVLVVGARRFATTFSNRKQRSDDTARHHS